MWPNAYPLGVLQAPHTDDASARLAMDAEGHERVHPEDDARYAAQELGVGSEAAEGGSVMKKEPSPAQLAKAARHPERSRELEAVLKAQLIAAVVREAGRHRLTHVELAARSGLPRSAVTGILSGSLQQVTIDRVLRLVEAAGLEADIRVRRAA